MPTARVAGHAPRQRHLRRQPPTPALDGHTGLGLGRTGSGPVVSLDRVTPAGTAATTPLAIDDLFAGDGSLDPDRVAPSSQSSGAIR